MGKMSQLIPELDTKDTMLGCVSKSLSFDVKSYFNISIVTEGLSVLRKNAMHTEV